MNPSPNQDGATDLDFEKKKSEAPDGGFLAWTVVLGSWCVLFCSFGWINRTLEENSMNINFDPRYCCLSRLLQIEAIKRLLGEYNCLDFFFANILYVLHGASVWIFIRQPWASLLDSTGNFSSRLWFNDVFNLYEVLSGPAFARCMQCYWGIDYFPTGE
ncbi:monocarboxylate permease [Penicillium taxi]|uniref:monocarboxylate permease n=1 Tax=Penicillium taxi TaxID=168475 RepID=UPI0025458BE8|nr:monocarboxylate permease [Penicillium taxi]KAJ5887524.1 monocarboxylate permease [Penicillium taxi]